jgi:hypothetical protein
MGGEVYRYEWACKCMRKRPMEILYSAGSCQGPQDCGKVRQNVVNNESDGAFGTGNEEGGVANRMSMPCPAMSSHNLLFAFTNLRTGTNAEVDL